MFSKPVPTYFLDNLSLFKTRLAKEQRRTHSVCDQAKEGTIDQSGFNIQQIRLFPHGTLPEFLSQKPLHPVGSRDIFSSLKLSDT
jgi:hypothetical protein